MRTAKGPTEWLLIKHRDAHADPEREVLEREDSVLTGATLTDLRAGRAAGHSGGSVREQAQALGRRAPYPTSVKPMLARLVDGPFSHPAWLFEPKLDGYRIVAFVQPGGVTLRSRNGKDLTSRLPEVARELAEQAEEEMVLDGEVVALNSEGRPDFGLLQEALGRERRLGAAGPEGAAGLLPLRPAVPGGGVASPECRWCSARACWRRRWCRGRPCGRWSSWRAAVRRSSRRRRHWGWRGCWPSARTAATSPRPAARRGSR